MASVLAMTSHGGPSARTLSISEEDKAKLTCIRCYTSLFRGKLDEQSMPLAALYNRDNEDNEVFFDAFLSLKLIKEKNKIKVNINADHLGKVIISKDVDYDFNYSSFISELEDEAISKVSEVISICIKKFEEYRCEHLN